MSAAMDRLFADCCHGTKWQHGLDEQCPCSPARFFRLPLTFVEPDDDSSWPKIVDADGVTVAQLFWPAHDGAMDVEEAELATYRLGEAFARAGNAYHAKARAAQADKQ